MIHALLLIATLTGPLLTPPVDHQEEVAHQVAAALTAGDAAALDALVDTERLWESLTGGLGLSRMALAEYQAESFPDFSFGAELCQFVPSGARVEVLPRPAQGEAAVVLRVAREFELEYVTLDVEGERLVDATVARVGESVLQATRRALAVELTRDKAGLLKKLSEPEKSYVRSISTLESIESKLALGESEAALAAYGTLPAVLQAERAFAFLRLTIASEVGEAAREAALGACLTTFPDDLGAALHVLDLALEKGEVRGVLGALKRLERLVPGDGMLACLRGRAHFERGDIRAAKIAYGKAVAAQPQLPAGHWGLIELALSRKDFRTLPKLLTALEKQCSLDLGDLSDRPEFEDFMKSRYYKSWNKKRER